MPLLVDEACDPDACEFKPLPAGGFIFGGTVVLHEVDERADHTLPHFSDGFLTEGWAGEAYEEAGDWRPIMIAHNDQQDAAICMQQPIHTVQAAANMRRFGHDRATQMLDAAVDAIGRGDDLHALSKALAGARLPQARPAEIARRLGSLGKSILDAERMIAHGLSNARCLWSGVCALEGHQAANGKVYDLGLSIDGHLSFPGREAGCSCVANGVVPGFG